ncbi:MFS transporter [Lactobacillus kunkeei] [Lactiplantibacillus mudanjiangensis]|uniref:MFS transporter n=1 Tax=Lactiplantibacillus mudanjiangensis TaxID=1296538 RepID=UPI0010154E3D|nr:MFS transporter [Lactiplantibacillus mudanjiangensis]VDG30857.1 MFS transporter [Lactobacillus kunkeei] [Lactiplantibacillus mudanjiangensis]
MSKTIKIALLMAASLFMEILDGTIVTTALPKIGVTFNRSAATTALLVSVYLITVAVFIPLSGWLAHRFGKKIIWLSAVALFTASSLGSALAPTFTILLAMRLLQGVAGSLMTPTARLIVLEKTEPSQLLRMVSYLVWPALIAPAIAPVLGGFIITYWSWHWIFFINLPIGIVILAIGTWWLAPDQHNTAQPFDWMGFLEIAASSILILVGAEAATRTNANWGLSSALVIIGLLGIGLVGYHLSHAAQPLFAVTALKTASFRICQTGGSLLWLSVGALPYLLTVYLQTIFGWAAVKAGGFVLFIFVGNIGIKPFTTIIIQKLSYRGALLAAFLMVLVSGVALAFIRENTAAPIIALLAMVAGMGRSLALTAYNGLSFAEIAPQDRNSANTLSAVVQTMAQGLGVSLITVVVHVISMYTALATAYEYGFAILGLLMLFPILEVWGLPKTLGNATLSAS